LEENFYLMEIYHPSMNDVLAVEIGKYTGETIVIQEVIPITGGSINTALQVKTNHGAYFAKYNNHDKYNGMFALEAKNLELLRSTRTLRIPKVVSTFTYEDLDFLVLENIEAGSPHYEFWTDLGFGLAHQHKQQSPVFGLDYNNFVGSLPQNNQYSDNWIEFFIQKRLEPMLKMAVDSGKADVFLMEKFERLYKKLPDIFPPEPACLLHGDLWSGNIMSNEDGDPVIFDPAVYYGHREMDIAMSKLFGGFEVEFYDAYNEVFPLEPHWEQRVQICNLYPLLIHVNLFMGAYIQSIKNIVNRY
jgi:protein-ribulosamine 3-kinase